MRCIGILIVLSNPIANGIINIRIYLLVVAMWMVFLMIPGVRPVPEGAKRQTLEQDILVMGIGEKVRV